MSIHKKFLTLFLCLVILPAFLAGAWNFYTVRASLEKEVFSKLESIAGLKVNNIEGFFKERRGDVLALQTAPVIIKNLPTLNRFTEKKTNPAYTKAVVELDNHLKVYLEAYGYRDIMLKNPDGKVVYCVNKDRAATEVGKPLSEPLCAIFEKGRKDPFFSNVYRDEIMPEQFLMMIAAPIHDSTGTFIGELAFEVDMETVYELIQDVTGLGETGETLIGKMVDGGATYLHPLRYDPAAALKKKVITGEGKGIPMLKATQGERGSGFSIDYRGEKVAAAWRYIPSLDCGIVAKIDFSEVSEPIKTMRNSAAVLLMVTLFLGAGIVFFIVRTITVPIINLTQAIKRIIEGNMSARVEVTSSDEIGVLGQYFNKMTEDLKQRTMQLETSNKELESFSYSVSHDLRAPLRAINGFSKIILEDYLDRLDDEGKRLFGIVRENAKKMGQLIDDILSFSRMGRNEMVVQSIDMEQLVEEVYQELTASVTERKIQFSLKPLAPVYGDRPMIRQVMVNLISNALKFTQGRAPAVIEVGTITGEREKGGIGAAGKAENSYYVKDNGVGFDMKYVDKLFGVFQRLHSEAEFTGTGIGLAIVKRVITRHGGRVWAEGKFGAGAVVYFTLPAERE
jgi:two-component system sensor kinase